MKQNSINRKRKHMSMQNICLLIVSSISIFCFIYLFIYHKYLLIEHLLKIDDVMSSISIFIYYIIYLSFYYNNILLIFILINLLY